MFSDRNLRVLAAALMVVGLCWVGAAADAPRTAAEAAVPVPSGWHAADVVYTFGPHNLWDYINGADALFIDYGFQELLVQDIEHGDLAATISLYDQGAPLNAFGIFQRERGTGGEDLGDVGAMAAAQPPYRGLMIKDRFYVKVDVSVGEADTGVLADLLSDIARALPGDDSLPEELSWIPAEHRVPGSLAFTRRDYLGLTELRDCVHAAYVDPESGLEYQVFALRPDARFLADPGPRWQAQDLEQDGARLLWRVIPYRGTVVMRGDASLMVGVAGLEDRDVAVAVLGGLDRLCAATAH